MKITGTKMLASAASVLLFGAMACAQSSGMSANSQSGTNGMSAQSGMNGMSAADKRFMDKAAQGGMAEVELGHLAEQNGSSQQVKDFGKRMVTDHSKANDQLKQLASQENVTLPTSLDAKDQATKDRLSKLQGAAFDKAYMKDMVMDHKKDVADFKHESMDAKNPQLKNWASETLPTLESHLQEAEKIAPTTGSAMGMNSGMSNGSSGAMAKQ